MASAFQINLNNQVGIRLAVFDQWFTLDYARAEKQAGKLIMTVPFKWWPLLSEYCQIEVWRQPSGGTMKLELDTLWFILSIRPFVTDKGEYQIEIGAIDSNLLLLSRVVPYYSGSAQTKKSGLAGNLLKAIARENIGSAANDYTGSNTTRGIAAQYFGVQTDLNDGATVENSFAWANVLDAMIDITDMSITAGTYMSFDNIYDGNGKIEFRTYANYRGTDRSLSGANPLLLDPSLGNLGETSVFYDYTNEVNFVYCGGQETGTNRVVKTSFDNIRIGKSPFARRETFQDARQSDTQTAVQDQADAALRAGRGTVVFSSKVIETGFNLYGTHYGFGDLLLCEFRGTQFTARLDKIHVSASGGSESIEVSLVSVA